MEKKKKPIHPYGVRRRSVASKPPSWLPAVLASFAGGVGVCLTLLAAFALLLTYMPVPLTLVRPLACLAAAAGAAVSGLVLARKIGKQLLLCGLGCGVFYGLCQITAATALCGAPPMQGSDMMLSLALLLSGTLGGTLAALRPGR